MGERISIVEYYLVTWVLLFGGFVMRVSWRRRRRRIGMRMFHIIIVIGTVMVRIRIIVVMAGRCGSS